MSKIIFLVLIFFSALSISSCDDKQSTRVLEKMEKLNESISNNSESMTEDDWNASMQSFENYKNDFESHKDEMTNDDRSRFNKSIGRFNALCSKRYVGGLKDDIKNFGNQAESFVKEILE